MALSGFRALLLVLGRVSCASPLNISTALLRSSTFLLLLQSYNRSVFLPVSFFAAVTPAKVWALDRRVFQQVMKRTGLQRIDDNLKFLRSVPLLERLTTDHMAKIADALEVVTSSTFSFLRLSSLLSILTEKKELCGRKREGEGSIRMGGLHFPGNSTKLSLARLVDMLSTWPRPALNVWWPWWYSRSLTTSDRGSRTLTKREKKEEGTCTPYKKKRRRRKKEHCSIVCRVIYNTTLFRPVAAGPSSQSSAPDNIKKKKKTTLTKKKKGSGRVA